nr:MAG TPA: hypothetical protein [Caudoviricetes sp.]
MKPNRYPYSFKPNRVNILDSRFYTRLIVETEDGAKKIAEVTLDDVTSATGYVVRLRPNYD